MFISSNGRGQDSKHGAPASHYYMNYNVYTCCIIWFQMCQWICDEMHMFTMEMFHPNALCMYLLGNGM